MKDIKIFVLDKYKTDDYKYMYNGVFQNLKTKKFHFTFEADKIDQYPLEDLQEMFWLACEDYCGGKAVEINGEKKIIAEVVSMSDSTEDFIKILNFSTIVGKEIINFPHGEYEYVGINYGDSNIKINGKEVKFPIVCARKDREGRMNFEMAYPELHYKRYFTNGQNITLELDSNYQPVNIILIDELAVMVFKIGNNLEHHVFNMKLGKVNYKGKGNIRKIIV